jgi:hypothetical protein
MTMKNHELLTLVCFLVVTPFLLGQTGKSADSTKTVTTPAPTPEEARKHFVMGTTLFKDAKTTDDFVQVASEFKQAADLAPQWPEPRYNLALAKEAVGDYSGAKADLKVYQQFKLSESEVRAVQDKLYALEAKAGAAARKQTKEQEVSAEEKRAREFKASQDNFSAFILKLEGSVFVGNGIPYEIYFLKHPMHNRGETPYDPPVPYLFCQRSVLEGGERTYNFPIPVIPTSNTEFDGGGTGYYGKFALSSDGRTLTEHVRSFGSSETTVHVYTKKE